MSQHVADQILGRVDVDAGARALAATESIDVRSARAWPLAVDQTLATTLARLLLANILLQMFDGVATYNGLRIGMQEGNPLLCQAFALWGVGPTLLLSKTLSCAVLLVLYWWPGGFVVAWGFSVLAVFYSVCSLIPWLATFVVLFIGWL